MIEKTQTERVQSTAALSDVREHLSEIVDDVALTGGEYVITKHGRPTAVLLSSDDYESLIETLNILSDNDAMVAISEAERELANGELTELS